MNSVEYIYDYSKKMQLLITVKSIELLTKEQLEEIITWAFYVCIMWRILRFLLYSLRRRIFIGDDCFKSQKLWA